MHYNGLIGFDEIVVYIDRLAAGFQVDGNIVIQIQYGWEEAGIIKINFIATNDCAAYLEQKQMDDKMVDVVVLVHSMGETHLLEFKGKVTSLVRDLVICGEAEIQSAGPVLLNGKPFGN